MPDLPDFVFETARAMTRAAERGTHTDPSALRSRRDALLASYGYSARVRHDDAGPVFICYPESWLENGVLQPEELDSTANALERPLFSAPNADGWDAIRAHNEELAAAVAQEFGEIHGANAESFGTYMANHHKASVEAATATQVEHFLTEYFPRNTWPTPAQEDVVEASLERLFSLTDEPFPAPPETSDNCVSR